MQVLATAQIPHSARVLLEDIGPLSISTGALAEELGSAEVLVVRAEPIDAGAIELARQLRVIARTGSGVDNVDVSAASARKIPVLNAPSAGTGPVAEGTWALILAAAKRLGELRACIVEGRWGERYAIEGLDLRESTLGIVGLGSIGREVARVGDAFGMRVIGYDARLPEGTELEVPVQRTDLDTLIRQADVVTLHCDLNDSTRGMVDRALLSRAERRPILINAARGGVLASDELLLEALEEGWLSAVGLDVFATEPLSPDSPLLDDPRIVCTPHSIGLTRRWNERVFKSLVRDIERVLEGRPPKHIVNPEVLEGTALA